MRGSIRQRRPGSWTIVYDQGRTLDGHRRQRRETIHGTRRDAERRLAERMHALDHYRVPDASDMTFNALADAFLCARKVKVSPTTYAAYERLLANHLRPLLGSLKIVALTPQHIEQTLTAARDHSRTKKRGKPVGNGCLRNILITIRACLGYAVKNEWIHRNVATIVEGISESSEREPILFTDDLVAQILTAAVDSEITNEVAFALGTGVRRGELCGLQWGDLDLERGWYSIRRNAVHIDREIVYQAPKTKKSRRSDALAPGLRELLLLHRVEQGERHSLFGLGAITETTFVFTDPHGVAWKPNELSRQFSRLVRRKELSGTRFHDLRHGHASLAFAAGVPLQTISESLGHSSIAITSRIYVHLLAQAREEKARLMERPLSHIRSCILQGRLPDGNAAALTS